MKFTIDVGVHDNTTEESNAITFEDDASVSSDSDVATSSFDSFHDSDESDASDALGTQNATNEGTFRISEIKAKSDETSEDLPEYLQFLLEGRTVCGDSRMDMKKPDWLDLEKFKRGQKFAVKYSFGVMYAEMISLMILFSLEGGLGPLIYTGNSDTPFKAFKRYLSTVLRVKSWHEEDIWDENSKAHLNLKTVRCMHEAVRHRMNKTPPEELVKKVTLEDDKGTTPMWTDLHEVIREDFRSSCPALRVPDFRNAKRVYVNQSEMAITQFGFVGLVLLFPKMFGIHDASDEDLDAFSYVWRTIGYCLGLEDRFNMCVGDLKTVQQRCRDLVNRLVLPSFRDVNRDWIHMSRCMVEGISYYVGGTTFQVALLYLCRVLSIDSPKLYASLSIIQMCIYYYMVFLYTFLLRVPGMLAFHNWLIERAIKRGQNKSPKVLQRLEARMYPYETQPGAVLCTRL